MRNPAIITASKLNALAQWPTDATETVVTFSYCDGPTSYTAKVKVNRNRGADSPRIVCGYCLTAVQALYAHPTRIGLCCADCRKKAIARAEKDADRIEREAKRIERKTMYPD